jgi:hypothetical protein
LKIAFGSTIVVFRMISSLVGHAVLHPVTRLGTDTSTLAL